MTPYLDPRAACNALGLPANQPGSIGLWARRRAAKMFPMREHEKSAPRALGESSAAAATQAARHADAGLLVAGLATGVAYIDEPGVCDSSRYPEAKAVCLAMCGVVRPEDPDAGADDRIPGGNEVAWAAHVIDTAIALVADHTRSVEQITARAVADLLFLTRDESGREWLHSLIARARRMLEVIARDGA